MDTIKKQDPEDSPMTAQTQSRFQQAVALHQRGLLSQAQAIYEDILKALPRHNDALHLLGFIALQTKNYQRAVDLIGKAIEICADNAAYYSNLGIALKGINHLDAAIASYDKAIEIKSDYADAYSNRGNALKDLKQFDAAVASYDRAIEIQPENFLVYYNRGHALQDLKQFDAAVASYDKAISIKADFAEAYSNRGVALQELKQFDAAVASYNKAIAIKADYANAYFNRGNALKELKQFDAAVASYDNAIAIRADYAEAYHNRGVALKELKQFDAAVASYDKAIAVRADYAEAYSSRGNVFQERLKLDLAVASYDKAIAIKADYAEAYWNKSLALLLGGDFDRGLELYEWRWVNENSAPKPSRGAQPLLLGKDSLLGKTILLYSEQGLGDTIQFVRYAKLVAALGARVILQVQQPLVGLLQEIDGVSEITAEGVAMPAYDFCCSLLSLPLAFKTNLNSIPCCQKYLGSDARKSAYWATKLGAKIRLRVGIAWSGSPRHKNDHNRSISLSEFITHLPREFQYVSLQKEVRDIDALTLKSHANISHYGDELNDFTDTAVLCEQVDVVISVDTSVAHLCGALGKPTWVLLPYCPDWRWLLGRDDSPWYPSVKLYRQDNIGDWTSVFARISADLARLTDIHGHS